MKRFPLKLSKFLKVFKEFNVLKMHMCLPKVILFLNWKEVEVWEMSNREIIEDLIDIAQAVTMQANLNMMPGVVESTVAIS